MHDALHWSVVVVCHPGRVPPPQQPKPAPKGKGGAAARRRAQQGSQEAGQEQQQQQQQHVVDLVGSEPGASLPDAASEPEAGADAAAPEAGAAAAGGVATPCILHLDSMGGGHSTAESVKPLYSYLEHEWRRKVGRALGRGCCWGRWPGLAGRLGCCPPACLPACLSAG